MIKDLPYRDNACLVIYNQSKQIFIGERTDTANEWQLPQGGLEEGYSIEENVLREASEELGVDEEYFVIKKQLKAEHRYDFANPPDYFVDKFRGQQQTFWILEYTGKDQQITLDRFQPEFTKWQWINPEEILEKTAEIRKAAYEKIYPEIIEYFSQS